MREGGGLCWLLVGRVPCYGRGRRFLLVVGWEVLSCVAYDGMIPLLLLLLLLLLLSLYGKARFGCWIPIYRPTSDAWGT